MISHSLSNLFDLINGAHLTSRRNDQPSKHVCFSNLMSILMHDIFYELVVGESLDSLVTGKDKLGAEVILRQGYFLHEIASAYPILGKLLAADWFANPLEWLRCNVGKVAGISTFKRFVISCKLSR
jgi:hypothetical protein